MLAVDPGFRADHLLLVETPLAPSKYGKIEDRTDNYRRVLERVRALPGVASAGYVNLPPLVFKGGRAYVSIEGEPPPSQADFSRYIVADRVAGEGYLETLGVPLLQRTSVRLARRIGRRSHRHHQRLDGKAFLARPRSDRATHQDRRAAGGQPLAHGGRRRRRRAPDGARRRAGAGVLPVRGPGRHALAVLLARLPARAHADRAARARGRRAASRLGDRSRTSPSRARARCKTCSTATSRAATRSSRWSARFAALALLLASVGLYGVLSYTIAQRTAEIGLRMALGAQAGNVVAGVLRGALRLASIGVALGVAARSRVTRFLGSFLFGVSPMDPTTLAGVAFVLVAVTIVASWLPALRAARVDPMAALRSD